MTRDIRTHPNFTFDIFWSTLLNGSVMWCPAARVRRRQGLSGGRMRSGVICCFICLLKASYTKVFYSESFNNII